MPKKSKSKAPDDPRYYYTATQAADVLGIHPETLRRNVRNGDYPLKAYEQPAYRAKRKYFFKIIEVELFAAKLEAAGRSTKK